LGRDVGGDAVGPNSRHGEQLLVDRLERIDALLEVDVIGRKLSLSCRRY
jgi:hypothetical protein